MTRNSFFQYMSIDNPTYNIGIIGGGHLGRALAKALLKNSIDKTKLKLSYSGKAATLHHLKQDGLEDAISTNASIAKECGIVFIAIRPDDINTLKGIGFGCGTIVVSCIAGCETTLLEKILLHKVTRIMPSSPITIEEGKAVCAIYPESTPVIQLLAASGFKIYPLAEEGLFNIFTACVCLPAAFLQMQIMNTAFSSAQITAHFATQFLGFEKMYRWAHALTPFQLPLQDKKLYISRMATKGGITEAIVNSLKQGGDFIAAIQKGIDRGRQIAGLIP
jgi:pyrroline-5-carboxylate reductase